LEIQHGILDDEVARYGRADDAGEGRHRDAKVERQVDGVHVTLDDGAIQDHIALEFGKSAAGRALEEGGLDGAVKRELEVEGLPGRPDRDSLCE